MTVYKLQIISAQALIFNPVTKIIALEDLFKNFLIFAKYI